MPGLTTFRHRALVEHQGCGELSADATEPGRYGYAVSIRRGCGGRMLRWVETTDAERDLPEICE